MPLTIRQINSAKPREKTYKLADGGGMYLEVSPRGSKYWRMKYRYGGKEKRLSFGVFPDLSLPDARDMREAARKLLAKGVDPGEVKKAEKIAQAGIESFEVVAREWFAKYSPNWKPGHANKIIRRLELNVFPWLGRKSIDSIEPPEVLAVLRRVESRGALETAHRTKQNCGQVFRYAVATGRAKRDPTADLYGALPPAKSKSFATITDPKQIGALLRAIDGYAGTFSVKVALGLASLTFVRPGELRRAEWPEFNLETSEWRIPADRMKMDAPHIVPLSNQAVDLIQNLYPFTGRGRYLFPGVRRGDRPMSENTVNAALRRMGYAKDEMTGHGFRHMASTLLNEQGWNKDAIERQLAHGDRDGVRATYNYAEYLPERRKMMQAWADYLDSLKRGADVVPIHAAK